MYYQDVSSVEKAYKHRREKDANSGGVYSNIKLIMKTMFNLLDINELPDIPDNGGISGLITFDEKLRTLGKSSEKLLFDFLQMKG